VRALSEWFGAVIIYKNNPHWRRHVIIEEETVKSSIDQIKCNYTHIDLMTEHQRVSAFASLECARSYMSLSLPLNFNGEVELFFCTRELCVLAAMSKVQKMLNMPYLLILYVFTVMCSHQAF